MLAQQPGGLTEVLKRGGTFFLFSKGGGAEMQLINPALSVRSVGLTLYRAQESSGRKWAVQTSIHRAGLRLLSFEQPACRSGPWLASGHLDLEKVLADKSPSRCPTHLVQTVCSTLPPAFLLRVWSLGTCQAECA